MLDLTLERHLVSQENRKRFCDLNLELESLNSDFADVSYVCGWCPTSKDTELYETLCIVINNDELARWPHLNRWHVNMKSFTQEERRAFPEEALLTPLAGKTERLKSTCYISKSVLDKKVRQSVACKQSCHKLLQDYYHGSIEDFFDSSSKVT